MFLGLVLRADSSCRIAVKEAIVCQTLVGSETLSANIRRTMCRHTRLGTPVMQCLS